MKLNIFSTSTIVLNHILCFLLLKYIKPSMYKFIFVYWLIGCISITAGLHRLWTHGSYKTNKYISSILMLFSSGTMQNSIEEWCSNHRMHHRFEDIDISLDPYSIKHKAGFLWAHIMGYFYDPAPNYASMQKKIKKEMYDTVWKKDKKLIKFQHKYYILLAILMAYIIPFAFIKILTKEDNITIIAAILLRLIILWHTTWSINSFAHTVGSINYSKNHTSGNNHLLSLITSGEGYHNYHHSFPKDYKCSENLKCINITGWLIYILYKLGFASDLKIAKVKRGDKISNNITYTYEK